MSRRVLVIDDDQALRGTLCRLFKRLGFDAVLVAAADEALRVADGCQFAVILSDYHLDGGNAAHLLRDLAALQPDASVIVMSGDHSLDAAAFAHAGTSVEVVHKPFTLGPLLEVLKDGLSRNLARLASRDRSEAAMWSAP
ncbi:MAG: response regulator [Deltaproteobacteria bacterium]|nr:response regulator [Deltaproteobacteria bacterium]